MLPDVASARQAEAGQASRKTSSASAAPIWWCRSRAMGADPDAAAWWMRMRERRRAPEDCPGPAPSPSEPPRRTNSFVGHQGAPTPGAPWGQGTISIILSAWPGRAANAGGSEEIQGLWRHAPTQDVSRAHSAGRAPPRPPWSESCGPERAGAKGRRGEVEREAAGRVTRCSMRGRVDRQPRRRENARFLERCKDRHERDAAPRMTMFNGRLPWWKSPISKLF
jgi:hypothetical protein